MFVHHRSQVRITPGKRPGRARVRPRRFKASVNELRKQPGHRLYHPADDAAKRAKRKSASKRSAKVPVADADSGIMPNKEGGYAPNFNPVAAVDGECGMIVDADVLNEMNEAETVIPTVERIESSYGQKPGQFLADSTFATGGNRYDFSRRGADAKSLLHEAAWC